jgi:hypothetical protein
MRTLSVLACCILSIGLAACGGGPNIEQFVGTWLYTSGDVTVSCGAVSIPPVPLAGTIRVLEQDSDGNLSLTLGQGCGALKFKVSGSTASLSAPVHCTISVPMADAGSTMVPVDYASETFTIDSSGKTLTEAGSIATTILITTCTFATSGTLSKQ